MLLISSCQVPTKVNEKGNVFQVDCCLLGVQRCSQSTSGKKFCSLLHVLLLLSICFASDA